MAKERDFISEALTDALIKHSSWCMIKWRGSEWRDRSKMRGNERGTEKDEGTRWQKAGKKQEGRMKLRGNKDRAEFMKAAGGERSWLLAQVQLWCRRNNRFRAENTTESQLSVSRTKTWIKAAAVWNAAASMVSAAPFSWFLQLHICCSLALIWLSDRKQTDQNVKQENPFCDTGEEPADMNRRSLSDCRVHPWRQQWGLSLNHLSWDSLRWVWHQSLLLLLELLCWWASLFIHIQNQSLI